jgi:hypothetical protein
MNRTRVIGAIALLALCACDESASKSIEPVSADVRFAVISTDYVGATSIALLDKNGDVIDDKWIGSYSADTELRAPLSQDVVMPTISSSRDTLTTVERGIGVISRFDIKKGSVIGQLRTEKSSKGGESSYNSNPYDVFTVNETSAWVTRWQPNFNTDPSDSEAGNDLIEIDPTKMVRKERRVDLSEFNTTAMMPVYDTDGNEIDEKETVVYARPSNLVGAGDFLVIGLSRLTENFDPGPSMIAVMNPVDGKITDSLEIDGLKNCGEVKPVVDSDNRVLVACAGDWKDVSKDGGIAMVEVDARGKVTLVENWRIADHKDAAPTQSNVISLGATIVAAVAPGKRDASSGEIATPDEMVLIDLSTGKQKRLFQSEGVFSIGVGAYNPKTSVLLVPDTGADESPDFYGLRRFIVKGEMACDEDGVVDIAEDLMLPARYVYLL